MAMLSVALLVAPLAAGALETVTPVDIAKSFYTLANEDRCSEAAALFTVESVSVINRTLGSSEGFMAFCAERGRAGNSMTLQVRSEKVTGDRARVEILRKYGDGSLAFEHDELLREGRTWKLVVGSNQVSSKRGK